MEQNNLRKEMLRLFVSIIVGLLVYDMHAQEIHFSAIRQLPYFFNPAYTGFIEEDVRAGLIYRNQSPTMSRAFNTLGYGVDFSLLKHKTDNNTVLGVGLNGYFDRAGTLGFMDNTINANFSFIQALDKKQRFYLSIGLQAGYSFRKIDASRATLEDGFDGISDFDDIDSDIPYANLRNNNFRLGTGALLFFNLSDAIKFHVGAGAFELARQDVSFIRGYEITQKPRFVANAGMEANIKQITIQPYFLAQIRKAEREILFGSMFLYNSDNGQFNNNENEYLIGGGVGYRYGNAVILSAMAVYQKFTLNFSYDINVSKQIRMTQTVGGIEVSIIYKNDFISPKNKKGKALGCPKMYF
jgi:type IX secretion system PorP/SprF family membrane protein